MKAKDLIAALQKFDPETPIVICADTEMGEYNSVSGFQDIHAKIDAHGSCVIAHADPFADMVPAKEII